MKISLVLAIVTVFAVLKPVVAWWDNGHMLVGEIATQLMDKQDVSDIEQILQLWEKDFPNTGKITTSTIWADQIKCSKVASYCPSRLTPSLNAMDEWHYQDLVVDIDGTTNSTGESVEGKAEHTLTEAINTFDSTHSTWSANFMIRYLTHVFGDVHQPLHTSSAVSKQFPEGDAGGNFYRFQYPCASSNLHAFWDAMGNKYTTNWHITMTPESKTYVELQSNASSIIDKYHKKARDTLNYADIDSLSFESFRSSFVKTYLEPTLQESNQIAAEFVYGNLDLTLIDDKYIKCPGKRYTRKAQKLSEKRVYLGGYRLSKLLTQVARQARNLAIVPYKTAPYKSA